MFEFGSSLSVRAVRGESAPARTVRKCGFRWHIRCIAGLRSRKKGRSRWSRRSANIPYCRLSVQDDCFVKDRVGSRLEIVGIGRFLLRVLYSVLIVPFDVVISPERRMHRTGSIYWPAHKLSEPKIPGLRLHGGSFVRDDRERRLFGSYFFQFARRNRAGDENQK